VQLARERRTTDLALDAFEEMRRLRDEALGSRAPRTSHDSRTTSATEFISPTMVVEHLLFVAHEGSVGSQRAAIIMQGHCLPIAVSHDSERSETGIAACWESEAGDVERFFDALGIENVCRGMGDTDPLVGGVFVYTTEYDPALDYEGDPAVEDEDRDGWIHLRGGEIRRPSGVELLRLTQGEPPWEGGVVL